MKRTPVDALACADTIAQTLRKGAFLTTAHEGKVNSMVIGWGHIGRIWELPVFVAYVRRNRYTRELLDANGEFTVNVPVRGFEPHAFSVCGTRSGRDMDKISEAGLTLVEAEKISVPAVLEYPLTMECRVLYRDEQHADRLPEEIRRRFYSMEADDHIAYYGEIVSAYMLEA